MPVGFELDRARKMVKDLVPDIQRNMHVIAQEEVEVDRLDHQIADSRQKLDKDKKDLLRLKGDAESAKQEFNYGGRVYTVAQVKVRSGQSLRAVQDGRRHAHQPRKRFTRPARRASKPPGRSSKACWPPSGSWRSISRTSKPARRWSKWPKPRATISSTTASLGQVKELVSDLRTRLQVAEKMVNAESSLHDEIPLDAPTPANIVDQVTDYFGHDARPLRKSDPVKVAKAEK